MRSFTIIVGYRASDRAIGKNGELPWKIPKDMAFFRKITTHTDNVSNKNAVIMGRNTFQSMKCQPLAGRINIVCTSMDMIDMPDMHLFFVKSLDEALEKCYKLTTIQKIFVIGGEQLYRNAIQHPLCEELIINEFSRCSHEDLFDLDMIKCDAFFPEVDEHEYKLILNDAETDEGGRSINVFGEGNVESETKLYYTNNDSIAEIKSCINESDIGGYIKIRYKKYLRKTV